MKLITYSRVLLGILLACFFFANSLFACVGPGTPIDVLFDDSTSSTICVGGSVRLIIAVQDFDTENGLNRPDPIGYYHIDFGDGSVVEKYITEIAPWYLIDETHTYSAPGTYTVTITVDDQGTIYGDDPLIITKLITVNGPTFTNITAVDSVAKRGDSVTISFTASAALTSGPTVTVNNHATGTPVKGSGNDYTCTYTVHSDELMGPSAIKITGSVSACNGEVTDTQALWILQSYTYSYDDTNNQRSVVNANGTSATYTYDERYQLRQIKNLDKTGGAISGATVNYTVDGVGNRTEAWYDEDRTTKNNLYTYDFINRLHSADYHNLTDATFTYDWVGNRAPYTYDDADRLLSDGILSYTYYDSGSMDEVLDGSTRVYKFNYDGRDLLKEVDY